MQTIDLSGCQGITDIGLSALGRGCGLLETILVVARASLISVYQRWVEDVVSRANFTFLNVKTSLLSVYQHCDGCGHPHMIESEIARGSPILIYRH
jgi:hypothetical protein